MKLTKITMTLNNFSYSSQQVHKQISLLANPQPQPQPPPQTSSVPNSSPLDIKFESQEDSLEERVIYVTYDVDEADSPAFHILSPEQVSNFYITLPIINENLECFSPSCND